MSEDGTVRLRASELNDFIGPSLACIKPVKEIKPKKKKKKVCAKQLSAASSVNSVIIILVFFHENTCLTNAYATSTCTVRSHSGGEG